MKKTPILLLAIVALFSTCKKDDCTPATGYYIKFKLNGTLHEWYETSSDIQTGPIYYVTGSIIPPEQGNYHIAYGFSASRLYNTRQDDFEIFINTKDDTTMMGLNNGILLYHDYADFQDLFTIGTRDYAIKQSFITDRAEKHQVTIKYREFDSNIALNASYSSELGGPTNANASNGYFQITDHCSTGNDNFDHIEITEGRFSCTLYSATDTLLVTDGEFIGYFYDGKN